MVLATEARETFCPDDLNWNTKACAEMIVDLPEPEVPKNPSLLTIGLEIIGEVTLPEDSEE